MIKKLLILFSLVGVFAVKSYAGAPPVREQAVVDHGTFTCQSISTSAWTAVPASSLANRIGLFVTVVDTATGNMGGQIGDTTPSNANPSAPITFKPGITQFHPLAASETLYLLSKNFGVASETVCSQELVQ